MLDRLVHVTDAFTWENKVEGIALDGAGGKLESPDACVGTWENRHMPENPVPSWAQFGKYLREARREADLSLDGLGARIPYSASLVSKIERGVRAPNQDIVQALDSVLGTNGELLQAWKDADRARNEPFWFEQAAEYEKQATRICFFHPFVLPGFFQEPEYARLLVAHVDPSDDTRVADGVADARQGWREKLRGARLEVVIPEQVLRAGVGGPEVMRPQMERLVREAADPSATIQVLPADVPDFSWTVGAFRLMYRQYTPFMLCTEHAGGEALSRDKTLIRQLERAFGRLQVWSRSPTDSVDMMVRIKESL
ncbi:helix-turn-helix transcriptional regulator [Nocardiopsis sp. RSe5-2]|uniref:Helix-turn-helix transcriptional regulator n=1 Tax=Nocardiopsis endophytica TaxID=3018445 RepID=A0ABT4U3I9_9ACTN|nr:helix-turn-helix transcriptional regulator [Nocardiopsis endophytica]MDA2811524.1 helix-turn-helix transcriptional regulator [Nocardiopsis endophytica]